MPWCFLIPACLLFRAGLVESVVTLDELANGDESRGTELEGIHREVLLRALRLLDQQGRAK